MFLYPMKLFPPVLLALNSFLICYTHVHTCTFTHILAFKNVIFAASPTQFLHFVSAGDRVSSMVSKCGTAEVPPFPISS